MDKSENPQRAAFSPTEFAALFGKSATWGYRQLYSGRVNAISGDGRIMIPASEVAKITGKAAVYDGKPPAKKKTRDKKPPAVTQPKTWQEQVKSRREGRSHFSSSSASRRIAKIFGKNTAKDKSVTPPQSGPS